MISSLIGIIFRLFELVIIVHVLLSYVLKPYHPVRETLSRFVEPVLAPIRRLIPTIGGLDFSPFILLIVLQFVGQLFARWLASVGL